MAGTGDGQRSGIRTVVVLVVASSVLAWHARAAAGARLLRRLGFVAGVLAVAVGLAMPDRMLSQHVTAHLLTGLAGPLLIAAGEPLALLAANNPSTAVRIRAARRHPAARIVTSPVVVWLLFNGGMLVLYLTPLYRLSMRNDLVHEVVHLHMLAAGLLFAELVVGTHPLPSRPSFPVRLGVLGLSLPVHGLIGLVFLSLRTPELQVDVAVAPAAVEQALDDQQVAAGIIWVVGDLLVTVVIAAIVLMWASDEERRQRAAERITSSVPS